MFCSKMTMTSFKVRYNEFKHLGVGQKKTIISSNQSQPYSAKILKSPDLFKSHKHKPNNTEFSSEISQ